MSDTYDPVSTQTTAITFRRLDALQDAVAIYGKLPDGTPVAILVALDGTVQTRRLSRLTDEIVLIGTDAQATARPVLVDSQGRLSSRPLSALPVTDADGVRAYFQAPGNAQVQGKADADGTLNVGDTAARSSLASILAQFDVPASSLRNAMQATQPRSVTNFPSDFPDALAQARLLAIQGQLDVSLSAHRDAITASLASTQPRSVTNFPSDYPDTLAQAHLSSIFAQLDRTLSEVFDVKTAHGLVTAGANTNGLTVTLDLGATGRPVVQRWLTAAGPATIQIQVSRDNASWRTVETVSLTVGGSNIATLPGTGYRYVRLTSGTTGIALEFEISASR